MSRIQDPPRSFLSFGNPFRTLLPKGSCVSPKLLDLLNNFEETLAGRLKKLKPEHRGDVLSLPWMSCAMESLSDTHADIKILITALELPVCDWDDKWIDVYLDNSIMLLDICIAFSSEITRLKQGHLSLQCILHDLKSASKDKYVCTRSSVDEWRQYSTAKNPRLDNCYVVIDILSGTLDLPKIKNSSKGKVLMRAMYGVKVVTLFIASIVASSFSGSVKKVINLQVSETYLWAQAFTDLQALVNAEIRNQFSTGKVTALKELEDVDNAIRNLCPDSHEGLETVGHEVLVENSNSGLEKSAVKFSEGLDLLNKAVDNFFQVILTGRNALLCNLRPTAD